MIYIDTASTEPSVNLAYEEYFLKNKSPGESYLMLWRDQPAVVVGRYQSIFAEVNLEYAVTHSLPVFRRISGGGAVYHDPGNLCFSLIMGKVTPGMPKVAELMRPIVKALARLGLEVEVTARNDLKLEGRKFSGHAMMVQKDRLLLHGTLLFDADLGALGNALRSPFGDVETRAVRSVPSSVTNLGPYLPAIGTAEQFKQTLKEIIYTDMPCVERTIAEDELAAVRALASAKYGSWAWTFGGEPHARIRCHCAYSGVDLGLTLELEKGHVLACRFDAEAADTAGLEEIERRLTHIPCDKDSVLLALKGSEAGEAVGRCLARYLPSAQNIAWTVTMSLIHLQDLNKHFKVLNRREGLGGAFRDLFSGNYRTVRAVDGISYDIEVGEIVGYIGPNGAGKSTTIKMMTGILKPSSGAIQVNGRPPFENRIRQAQIMGVVFGQRTQLWWDLPVIESFKILKEIYKVDQKTFDAHLGLFNELVGLKALYSQQVRTLSLGQRMLCDITASFLHNPQVVFLDEPTIGLDISIKAKMRSVIKELNRTRKTTILLTTHDLGDVEALCQRIIIIDKGKILYDGDIKRVTALFGAYRTLKLQIDGFDHTTIPALRQRLNGRFGTEARIEVGETEEFWTDVTIDQARTPMADVLSEVISGFAVCDVRIVEISMESVVHQVYDGALR